MDDIVITLFAGPADRIGHALDLAERAGFWATRVRSANSGAAFVQLLDVLTDETVDAGAWASRTAVVAETIMCSLGFELVSLSCPRLV